MRIRTGIRARIAPLLSRFGASRPKIEVSLVEPTVHAGETVRGSATVTAGAKAVSVRPIALAMVEYWPEHITGDQVDMSSDTLATVNMAEGFALAAGETRTIEFSVVLPLGSRLTRGELDVSPPNEGCRVRAYERAPLGTGAYDAAFVTVRPPRIVGAVDAALVAAGFFTRPVESRRSRDYVLRMLRPRDGEGGVDEMSLGFRVEPDRCFCFSYDERTVARALAEGWGPPPKERPAPSVVELLNADVMPSPDAVRADDIYRTLSPLFEDGGIRLSDWPGAGGRQAAVEAWVGFAQAKQSMVVLTGRKGTHVHVWFGASEPEIGVQDVGRSLSEAALRELTERGFHELSTGASGRLFVIAMGERSVAELADVVLGTFRYIVGEDDEFEPSVMAFD